MNKIAFASPKIPTTTVAGVPVAALSMAELTEQMIMDCRAPRRPGRARTVFDINGQALSMRETDSDYRTAFDAADIVHADGGFIVGISRLRGDIPIPERSATTDFIWQAAAGAERAGLSFFLLGGEPGLAERAAEGLRARHPGLKIAGTRNGYFSQQEETGIIAQINASEADIVWVGLGKPREQVFSTRNRDRLDAGWIVTCGGCFNFVTGGYRRAPRWMQKTGLEWLHRMASRPKSLFMRYLITNPHALYLALTK